MVTPIVVMPMRDRLLGPLLAASSPGHQGELPMQLPPPPPGMPADQVAKWRKEVAKIVSKQHKEEIKLLKQRQKEQDRFRRDEEKMRTKVEKLARKMQQESSTVRSGGPIVPPTQQESPNTSPRGKCPLEYSYAEDEGDTLEIPASTKGNNKENTNSRVPAVAQKTSSPIVSQAAAEEVSKVLAARRERVEQAMQANDRRKEELSKTSLELRERDVQTDLERQELYSFEQRIPNKQRLQQIEAERAAESAAQREAKEVANTHDNRELNTAKANLLLDLSLKLNAPVVKVMSPASKSLDASDMDYVIDEIPEQESGSPCKQSAEEDLCGIGITIAQNREKSYVVLDMSQHGSASKSGLLCIGDLIECIDGQIVSSLPPDAVGSMIRGTSGSQVVLDILSGPKKLRTRVGITRAPIDKAAVSSSMLPNTVPQHGLGNDLRKAAITSAMALAESAMASSLNRSKASNVERISCEAPVCALDVTSANAPVMKMKEGDKITCGVGLSFEFHPFHGTLVIRKVASNFPSPFSVGDCLKNVNGTCVAANALRAPSLIWGDAGSSVVLTMTRGSHEIKATVRRRPSELDSNLISMCGGSKTCGIGVVLDDEPKSQYFFVKRVVQGGPAHLAGVLQGDVVTRIDDVDLHAFGKDQLPSLILGPEGSALKMQLMRAGEQQARQMLITRSLDAAKAQESNLTSQVMLTFDSIESVGSPLEQDRFSSLLHADIVAALSTVATRIQVARVCFDEGSAIVHVLPDFNGGDCRSVQELVLEFVRQGSSQQSPLRLQHTCKSLAQICVLGQVDPAHPSAAEGVLPSPTTLKVEDHHGQDSLLGDVKVTVTASDMKPVEASASHIACKAASPGRQQMEREKKTFTKSISSPPDVHDDGFPKIVEGVPEHISNAITECGLRNINHGDAGILDKIEEMEDRIVSESLLEEEGQFEALVHSAELLHHPSMGVLGGLKETAVATSWASALDATAHADVAGSSVITTPQRLISVTTDMNAPVSALEVMDAMEAIDPSPSRGTTSKAVGEMELMAVTIEENIRALQGMDPIIAEPKKQELSSSIPACLSVPPTFASSAQSSVQKGYTATAEAACEDTKQMDIKDLQHKFPHRIPIVVHKVEDSAPDMKGHKFLVPDAITIQELQNLLSERIEDVPAGKHLVISVAGRPLLDRRHDCIQGLFETYRSDEGFLLLSYDLEEDDGINSKGIGDVEQATGRGFCETARSEGPPAVEETASKAWISLDSSSKEARDCSQEQSLAPPSFSEKLTGKLSERTATGAEAVPLAGVGLKIERDLCGKGFRITGVAPDGPASRTVIKINDYLIAVDTESVHGKRTSEVADLLKGAEGSKVRLTLCMPRGSGEATHTITLVRAAVARNCQVFDKQSQEATAAQASTVAKASDKVHIFGFNF